MSVKFLDAVFDYSAAEGAAYTVFIVMADWADQNGRCYPSYGQIAKKARVSRATAIAAIARLVDLGELKRVPFGRAPDHCDDEAPRKVRSQWRNTYQIALLERRRKVVQPDDHLSDQVVQSDDSLRNPQVVAALDHLHASAQETAQVVQPGDHLHLESDRVGSPIDVAQVVQSTRSHIRNKPSGEPSEVLQAGAPPRPPDTTTPENPDDNLALITKIAHEVLDVEGVRADLGLLADAVKWLCAQRHIAYDVDVVRKAIDSARWQRTHRSETG